MKTNVMIFNQIFHKTCDIRIKEEMLSNEKYNMIVIVNVNDFFFR